MSNNILKKIQDIAEPEINKIITNLMGNEKFTAFLEKAVTQTLKTKDALDTRVKAVLASMGVTTRKDLDKVASKADHAIKQAEKVAKDFEKKIEKAADEVLLKAKGLLKEKAAPAKTAAKPKAARAKKAPAPAKPKAAKKSPAKAKPAK